jgi:hypothetical protein
VQCSVGLAYLLHLIFSGLSATFSCACFDHSFHFSSPALPSPSLLLLPEYPAFELRMGQKISQSSQRVNGEMGSVTMPPAFTLKDEPVENLRPLKVRVIGAGYSGIYLGIRIPQRLRNVDLRIYEKNEGVGGTWWENRYPGMSPSLLINSFLSQVSDDLRERFDLDFGGGIDVTVLTVWK